ncbi:peroxidase family protein [Micromonospora parva]|uniref:peroxidase family protein n=1 Tax=Micromonospora parva TaxID=1464048 RepID=UPI00365E08DE
MAIGNASPGVSRRRLLAGVGAGALLAGTGGVLLDAAPAAAAFSNRFGRMFPSLPAFGSATTQMRNALIDLSRVGGPMDARDPLGVGAEALSDLQQHSINNPDNFSIPQGMTYFGQFVDHDLAFETTAPLGTPVDPTTVPNPRTPALDLDSLYGAGPTGNPELYTSSDPAKLRIESGGRFEDLPRNSSGRAIVFDPRNDENLPIAQITAAFILFHNRVVDLVRAQGTAESQVFAAARRLVTWHYQWIVLNEFLPLIAGPGTVSTVLSGGRRFYRPEPNATFIPVEFTAAAFRFGHSQPRPAYLVNRTGNGGDEFYAMLFDSALGGADPADLRGGMRAARRYLDYQFWFQFFDGQVRWSKWIDVRNSTPLFGFPLPPPPSGSPSANLLGRDLLRQLTFGIPSGQRIAAHIGAPALGSFNFPELSGYGLGLDANTPLFYYILKEAQLQAGGGSLGAVGGRIVAEVLIGIAQLDPASYLTVQPSWRPTLPARFSGQFTMADLLTYARVDPASRNS